MKSGQILILVLLIVVVSLAVGLSVASRNLTNLKISTQSQESQRAFSAAEGGVEDTLSRLNAIKSDIGTGTYTGVGPTSNCDISGLVADCNNRAVGDMHADIKVKAKNTYETTVELGEVAQVTLINPGPPESYYSGTLSVEWLKTG